MEMENINTDNLINSKYCFFITPIGNKESEDYKKMTAIEKNILKPILEAEGYELKIAHKLKEVGSISDQIFSEIINAKLIIANLTGLNPNVMYETAVAHSFDIPTIMITEDIASLPFDLKMDRSIEFSNTIEGSGDLKEELEEKIKNILSDQKYDNPIKRVIQRTAAIEDLSEDSSENNQLVLLLEDIQYRMTRLEKRDRIKKNQFVNNSDVNSRRYSYSNGYGIIRFEIGSAEKFIEEVLSVVDMLNKDLERMPTYEEIAEEMDISKNTIYSKVKILSKNKYTD